MVRDTMMLKLVVVMCLTMTVVVDSSQTVMKSMTKNFLKAYEVCAKEYSLKEGTAGILIGFWKDDFSTTSRDVGCAILCLSTKLDLIDPEGKLHHGKATEFAMQHGSGEEMAKKLVEILHNCEQTVTPNEDKCMRALDIAMCFKKELHTLGWAPDPELLFEELIAEMR
uniref:Pheromone binding protein 1 n=1 Tax=Chilo suppressalis TaxID=168631 RepID=E0XKK0_CHISP|nr:pheromone binding protein 1 [Chilo suppressalis]